jgi:hypothetical protein
LSRSYFVNGHDRSGHVNDRTAAEESNHWHRRLLRARRKRPRGCRAAEQRDEVASM